MDTLAQECPKGFEARDVIVKVIESCGVRTQQEMALMASGMLKTLHATGALADYVVVTDNPRFLDIAFKGAPDEDFIYLPIKFES